jgi:hypothetical protein
LADKEDDARFLGGPRLLGALIPRLTRPAFRRKSPAGAQLMADWPSIIGPALAAVTAPQRLTGGTLTLACAGTVAMELTHLAPQIIQRINAHLGRAAVERLRFVQLPPAGATTPRRVAPAPAPELPPPVRARLDSVPDEELREALARLARGVYRNG